MQVLPVLDLLGGQVVRGVAGNRREYRPIQSLLCADATPLSVGRAFLHQLHLPLVYVADLDAIAGCEPAWNVYQALLDIGLKLWVDAGVGDEERAKKLAEFNTGGAELSAVIVGLESLPGPELLANLVAQWGQKLVFSLDMKHGQPLVGGASWHGMSPEDVARQALNCGVRRFILLDLARVGRGNGVGTEHLCRWLKQQAPVEVTTGGGVRHAADMQSLEDAGCDFALVASALHDGRLTVCGAHWNSPS